MMKKVIVILGITFISFQSIAGNICYKGSIEQDGCTGLKEAAIALGIYSISSVTYALFNNSCDTHDLCWGKLGSSANSCDSEFRSKMRSSCNSKFNKYLLPVENQTCKAAAQTLYGVVQADPLDKFQEAQESTIELSRSYVNAVDNEECGTTPLRTNIYSDDLLSYIDSTFSAVHNRTPSVYESFDMLDLYDTNQSVASWENDVATTVSLITTTPPVINISNASSQGSYKLDASGSEGNSLIYSWIINGTNSGTSVYQQNYAPYPRYTQYHYFKGYLLLKDVGGNRNLEVIDDVLVIRGLCSNPSGPCNQIP